MILKLALVFGVTSSQELNGKTLREAAEGTGLLIGTALAPKSDTKYNQMALEQYNLITPENDCKMSAIAKSFNDYKNYGYCKVMADRAKES